MSSISLFLDFRLCQILSHPSLACRRLPCPDCQRCGPVQLSTKGLLSVDELRRGLEDLPEAAYKHRSYYEKWAASVASIQMERGNISQRDIDAAMGKPVTEPEVK